MGDDEALLVDEAAVDTDAILASSSVLWDVVPVIAVDIGDDAELELDFTNGFIDRFESFRGDAGESGTVEYITSPSLLASTITQNPSSCKSGT